MTNFYTSDTHVGHARIVDLCNRPFRDVAHMNDSLVDNWNTVVGPDDNVFHLGDVALGPWSEWDGVLSRLNGHKFLVVGNHDRVFAEQSQKQRDRFHEVYLQWFELYAPEMVIEISGQDVRLSHFPYGDGDSHGEARYTQYRPVDDGVPLIHGHTHDSNQWFTLSEENTPMFHVGVDAHNYGPVPESTLEAWLKSL